MEVQVGTPVQLDRHTWTVERIAGNFCYVKWGARKKVIPLDAAIAAAIRAATPRPSRKDLPPDAITQSLQGCKTPDDLLRVALAAGLAIPRHKVEVLLDLPNFGMQRMYVGNQMRSHARKSQSKL